MPSRGKLLPRDHQGIFRSRNLVLVCLYSTLPQEVPYLLLNPQSLKLGGVERKKESISVSTNWPFQEKPGTWGI